MRKNPVRLLRPATLAFSVLVRLPRPSAAAPDDVKELSAQAPTRPSDMPLSLLPEPPPLELPAPRPASLEAIDDLLARLVHADANVRDGAARELLEVKPDWVSGLSRRIDRIAERADKGAMRLLLEKLRERAKKKRSKEEREEGVESLGVVLENGHRVIVYTAGRMRRFRIRSVVGDAVRVEMTPYDLSKGRLVYRERGTGPVPPSQRKRRGL